MHPCKASYSVSIDFHHIFGCANACVNVAGASTSDTPVCSSTQRPRLGQSPTGSSMTLRTVGRWSGRGRTGTRTSVSPKSRSARDRADGSGTLVTDEEDDHAGPRADDRGQGRGKSQGQLLASSQGVVHVHTYSSSLDTDSLTDSLVTLPPPHGKSGTPKSAPHTDARMPAGRSRALLGPPSTGSGLSTIQSINDSQGTTATGMTTPAISPASAGPTNAGSATSNGMDCATRDGKNYTGTPQPHHSVGSACTPGQIALTTSHAASPSGSCQTETLSTEALVTLPSPDGMEGQVRPFTAGSTGSTRLAPLPINSQQVPSVDVGGRGQGPWGWPAARSPLVRAGKPAPLTELGVSAEATMEGVRWMDHVPSRTGTGHSTSNGVYDRRLRAAVAAGSSSAMSMSEHVDTGMGPDPRTDPDWSSYSSDVQATLLEIHRAGRRLCAKLDSTARLVDVVYRIYCMQYDLEVE